MYPAQSSEVGGLRTVEAMIEASMVAVREGDHELSGFLGNLTVHSGAEERQRNRDRFYKRNA